MTSSDVPKSSVYHIVLFAFQGSKRAGDAMDDILAAQKRGGYRIVAQAVVERDPQGEVHVHEPGRGGVGGTVGAVAGGLLGLLGGPLAVVVLAVAGGTAGGIAGHFAGRAIPTEDLRRMGNELPPDSSGLVVLAEDTEAERMISDLGQYSAQIVTVEVGSELSGEIAVAVAADVAKVGGEAAQAAPAAETAATDPSAVKPAG
jgi:uncharacterized membrane protein